MKYIWLIGSNDSFNYNNDSFYFWKNLVQKKDEILKYYILKKDKKTKEIYKNLTHKEKKYVVWANSFKHFRLFLKADMFFISKSESEFLPTKVLKKKVSLKITKPIIILNDNTNYMVTNDYSGKEFNNNIFKLILYNKNLINKYKKLNDFKEYQLDLNSVHPRYTELEKLSRKTKTKKQILWVIDRDKYDKKAGRDQIIRMVNRVLKNKQIIEFINKEDIQIKVCLSQIYKQEDANNVLHNVDSSRIKVVSYSKVNFMKEACKSNLLITDNSTLGYDFTFLNKPVLLFNPNLEDYIDNRDTYYSLSEMKKYVITDTKELISKIIGNDYALNDFFKKGISSDINHDDVSKGYNIDYLYNKYKDMQLTDISFIGYNFYGRGGTVSATYSLAEALLEKGFLVHMMSLKQTALVSDITVPYGLNINYIYSTKTRRKLERIKKLMINKKHFSYLKYDSNLKYLIPYAGYGLKKYLSKVKANTVVSTRDSFHFFLKEANNKNIENKVYFFHADANVIEKLFPGASKKLFKLRLEKCAFVTETNRLKYIDKYGFKSYDEYAIVGNSLTSDSIISKEEIHTVSKKDCYRGIYLTRISKDRVNDLNNAIEFAKYLKANKIDNIVIDIYGKGDYVDQFEDIIYDLELENYLNYKGLTINPHEDLINHDFCIDFSLNQSFGMTYIEGILNGLVVFAYHNYGSNEVLKDIPYSFINSNEELVEKIYNLPNIKKQELVSNYENIASKYSRKVVADNFIELLKK